MATFTHTPTTSEELTATLLAALPGDIINLLPIDYHGQFKLGPPQHHRFQPIPNAIGQMEQQHSILLRGSTSQDGKRQTTIIHEEREWPEEDEEMELEDILMGFGTVSISGGKWTLSDLTIQSNPNNACSGVLISSSGHSIQNITINQCLFGVEISADNNHLEKVTINSCNWAISVSGRGNWIQNCELNRIKKGGIMLEESTTTDTLIEDTVVRMKTELGTWLSRAVMGKSFDRGDRASLVIRGFPLRTRVKGCTFYGDANICGCEARIEDCTFQTVFYSGMGNEIAASKIKKLCKLPPIATLVQNNSPACQLFMDDPMQWEDYQGEMTNKIGEDCVVLKEYKM